MPNIRGLTNWLQQKKVLRDISVDELRGATIGVDAWKYFSSYIPTDVYSEVVGQVQIQQITDVVKTHLKLFLKYKITPIFVFSGIPANDRIYELAHPATPVSAPQKKKNGKQGKGKNTSQKNQQVSADDMSTLFEDKGAAVRDMGWDKMQQGAPEAAVEVFSAVEGSLTSQHRKALMDVLQELGAAVMVAPYQAAAQLAWLDKYEHKMTHASFGNNDLLLYGASTVLTVLNLARGAAQIVHYKDVLQTIGISHTQLVHAAMLAGHVGCPTFPAVADNNFNFANVLALVVKFDSLQAVVDSHTFKPPQDKATYVAALNGALDQVECAMCAGPGGEIVSVRARTAPAERVSADKTKAKPAAPSLPQVPMPTAVASLLAANAVSPSTAAALICGKLVDLAAHVPSEEVHVLLDWANTHIRVPAARLALAALAASHPDYRAALQVRDGAAPDEWDSGFGDAEPSAVSNVRWSDQSKGVWPRDLTPKTNVRVGQLFASGNGEQITKDIVVAFSEVAGGIDVQGSLTLTNALLAVAAATPSTEQAEPVLRNTQTLATCAVLLVLFLLGCLDERAQLTAQGRAVATALQGLAAASENVRESAFAAALLARAKVIDARILTLTACRPHMEQTVAAGKGLTDVQHQRVRLLTRLAAVALAEQDSERVEVLKLNQELCAVSNIANALLASLRFACECTLITAAMFGEYTAASGVPSVDEKKTRPCDYTQISAIAPYGSDVMSDPSAAITLLHSLQGDDTAAPTENTKTHLNGVAAIVAAMETSGADLSFSSAQLQDALTIL